MSAQRETVAAIGIGAAACAACCAGPVVGFLAAVTVPAPTTRRT